MNNRAQGLLLLPDLGASSPGPSIIGRRRPAHMRGVRSEQIPLGGAPENVKLCRKCGRPGAFHKQARCKDGLQTRCVTCVRAELKSWREKNPERHRMADARWKSENLPRVREFCRRARTKSIGWSNERFAALWTAQSGCCSICRIPMTDKPGMGRTSPCRDHCHTTGKARGLICSGCNTAIGYMRDKPELLRLAAEYLETDHG